MALSSIRAAARASFVARTRRYQPSFSHLLHHAGDRHDATAGQNPCPEKLQNPPFLQQRSFLNTSAGFGSPFRGSCSVFSPNIGSLFCRYMSTTDGTDNIETISDVAEAAVANEVAVAAADSFPPVMLMQHLIDSVHQFTGLNWAASIALTTLLIRTLLLPVIIHHLKVVAKFTIIMPRLKEKKAEIERTSFYDLVDGEESASEMELSLKKQRLKEMKQMFIESGGSPFAPMYKKIIHGSFGISFLFAISNMVEKVPSFKTGGAYWFTDLTTPDSYCILPVLTGLTFIIYTEPTITKYKWGIAATAVPATMFFSQAHLCYFIASRVTTILFSHVLDIPAVRKYLGIPQLPEDPQTATGKSSSGVPEKEVMGRKENKKM